MITIASSTNPLCHTNLVETLQRPQAERQSLRSASYADEAGDGAAGTFLFYTQVGKSILTCIMLVSLHKFDRVMRHTENASSVQVGRQELAVAFHRRFGCKTAHVG
jgi:hypothetical protein